jgi:2-keto-4-pentenoate hydratase/2-oxohepta-3-ene-1,7-dioic acid hydratase in catechol pathway
MRLASFRAAGSDRIGFELTGGRLVDAAEALGFAGGPAAADPPGDMLALIRAGAEGLAALYRAHTALLESQDSVRTWGGGEVTWHAPVPAPSKVVCLALNNRALDAIKIRAPTDHPAFFLKPSTAVTGHRCAIRLRASFGLTHPEPELGVVIGHALENASPATAIDGVYGYTIVNDVTSVGMREEDSFSVRCFKPGSTPGELSVGEAHTTYPGRYKASDTFAPMGPWLVTRDEVPDPAALRIECRLGDKLVASDHTRNYVWGVADALSQISRTMTLLPGDVVSMGTAVGGEADDPETPEVPGVTRANLVGFSGEVSITISRLGTLVNTIRMI